jgi:phytol kinase
MGAVGFFCGGYMSKADILGLIFSYVYAFGLLFLVEAIGKKFNISQFITRKIIHIGAGLWTWAIVAIFDHWLFGIIPFATFIFLNYIFNKKKSFEQMDDEESSLGTVYFAFSITVLFLAFWRTDALIDRVHIALAGCMAMTLGDAAAALLGKHINSTTFHVFGNTKSIVGSIAMFLFSFAAIFFTLSIVPGSDLSPASAVLSGLTIFFYAVITAVAATAVESLSPSGTDNLTVPLLTGLLLFLLIG